MMHASYSKSQFEMMKTPLDLSSRKTKMQG